MADDDSGPHGDSVMKLTQEFLGHMIGSQRSTVSEVVRALEERGALQMREGRFALSTVPASKTWVVNVTW
jgi:DNA-binding FadR family transcriptional regulator